MSQPQQQQRIDWQKRFKDYNEYQREVRKQVEKSQRQSKETIQQFQCRRVKKSTRIFKSATPKYTWDWYLKWVSSILVLGAMSIRGIPELQQTDLILSIFGITGWVAVSIAWKDRALIMLNTVGLMFLLRNLITLWVQ